MNNEIIIKACNQAQLSEEFTNSFINKINKYSEIKEELLEYLVNGNLIGKENVKGYTVFDIYVWQINHFKANLDYAKAQVGSDTMEQIICAYDVLLNMKDNPEMIIRQFQSETGTDYPGKYN